MNKDYDHFKDLLNQFIFKTTEYEADFWHSYNNISIHYYVYCSNNIDPTFYIDNIDPTFYIDFYFKNNSLDAISYQKDVNIYNIDIESLNNLSSKEDYINYFYNFHQRMFNLKSFI